MQDKTVLITGAGSGIGREMAIAFAREGGIVGVADTDLDPARNVQREIQSSGGRAQAIQLDVTVEHAVDSVIARFAKDHGRLDVLVANAGVQHLDAIADVTFQEWKRVLAVHLEGSFLTARAALREMIPAKRGAIIFMGSVHSYMVSEKKGPYAVAKHGIVGLCRAIAKENGRDGIRANTICPGFVRTPLIDRQLPVLARERGVFEQEIINQFLTLTVDNEPTTPQELAELAILLAALPTNVLNGQSIGASHGIHML